MEKIKVLIVDDEPGIRELFVDTLSPRGYEVLQAGDGESAIALARQKKPSIAFLDIRMPGMDGVELLTRLKSLMPELRVVMITGHGKDDAVEKALVLGTFACLMKPFSVRDIVEMAEIVQLAA